MVGKPKTRSVFSMLGQIGEHEISMILSEIPGTNAAR
jgi:hypothetical protein